MTTYGTMQTRIADEIARADLTSQIQLAIQTAIDTYERKRFYFNEARSLTFSTVASQEFYGSADLADIPNLVEIDELTLSYSATDRRVLNPVDYSILEALSIDPTSTSVPESYCYYGQEIRLYPIPDDAYTVRISGVKRLSDLSAAGDTNAWMTDGEKLIRSCAKNDLFTNVIRSVDDSAMMTLEEDKAYKALLYETARRISPSRIIPTEW